MIAIFPQLATCAVAKDWEMLGILMRSYFAGTENKEGVHRDLGLSDECRRL